MIVSFSVSSATCLVLRTRKSTDAALAIGCASVFLPSPLGWEFVDITEALRRGRVDLVVVDGKHNFDKRL